MYEISLSDRTTPSSGVRTPATILSIVVFPTPLGPTIAVIEPVGTLKVTSSIGAVPSG